MSVKLCKDCKHSRPRVYRSWFWRREDWSNAVCHEGARYIPDPVTGENTWQPAYCAVMRGHHRCGPEGKLFEPRKGD